MTRRDIPNLISLLRIVLVAPVAALLAEERYDWALALFAVAGASDGLDGWLARRFDWRSRLGALLDPLADKLLLTVCFVTLALLGALPWWLAAAVVARDLVIVVGGISYHRRIGRFEIEPSLGSKPNTFIQIGFVLAVVVALEFSERIGQWLTPELLAGWGWLVLATTVGSGIDYVARWGSRARRALRDAEEIDYPKIAQDRGPYSRRGKGRMVVPCNPCRNAEDGPRDK